MDLRKCLQLYSELVKTLYRHSRYGTPLDRKYLAKLLKGVALWCPASPDLRDALNHYANIIEWMTSEELDEFIEHSKLQRYIFEDLPTSINLELGSLHKLLKEIEA